MRAALGRPLADAAPPPASRHRAPPAILRVLRTPGGSEQERRGAVAMALVVAVVAVGTAVWVFASRPHSVDVPTGGATGSRPPTAAPTSPAAHIAPSVAPSIVVDVAGKVPRPGLYRLPAGSRVDDAVRAAGGALVGVDLATLNLAAVLVDGQQVAVGVPPAPGGLPAAEGGHTAPAGPVSLNSATLEQLQALPGVGPVLAQHILDWRAQHGSFASIDELRQVTGFGDAKFAAVKSLVTL